MTGRGYYEQGAEESGGAGQEGYTDDESPLAKDKEKEGVTYEN